MNYTELSLIDPEGVEAYRGNTGFTTIYMKSGETFYAKEDFETVYEYIGL